YYSRYSQEPDSVRTRHQILPGAEDLLVPMLCETGRFFIKPAQNPEALLPLKWESGPPWAFKVEVRRDDAAGEYIIKGILFRDGAEKPLSEPLLLVSGLVFFTDHVAPFDDGDMFAWLRMLRTARELKVPF